MVAAVIVAFHPDVALMERCLRSLCGQVAAIYIVDNTPPPSPDLDQLLDGFESEVHHLRLGGNKGLAAAQNVAIGECLQAGFSHILFFDQDSVPPENLTQKLLAAERDLTAVGVQVAAVGPLFIDKKTHQLSYAIRYGWFRAIKVKVDPQNPNPVESDWLISSGSLISASAMRAVGPMKPELFIDWVDTEWGLRARCKGFKCFVIPGTLMEHSVGDASKHLLGYTFNLHNQARNYYIVRNATYLLFEKSVGLKWVSAMLLRIPKHILVHTVYSGTRFRSFRFMMKGVKDGFRGRLGRLVD